MIIVVSGPSMMSVVFRLVRSWLFCNSGFWSHVSGWVRLVGVFAVVPLGVSCSLPCWVGGYFAARHVRTFEVVSSRHSAAGGHRVMRARLVFWGREPVAWVQMQLTRNRHFLVRVLLLAVKFLSCSCHFLPAVEAASTPDLCLRSSSLFNSYSMSSSFWILRQMSSCISSFLSLFNLQ